MAKMFYSLEETAKKLGIDEEQVKELAAGGEIQQFRDRDKLMFKREQIDNLVPEAAEELGDLSSTLNDFVEDDGLIPLVDEEDVPPPSLEPETTTDTDVIDLITADTDTGSWAGSDSSVPSLSQPTTDDSHVTDAASDLTQITDLPDDLLDEQLPLEQIGSGSGLLDLTREIDDTSLGPELLDEIYPESDSEGSGSGSHHAIPSSGDSSSILGSDANMDTPDPNDPMATTPMDTAITSSGIFDTGVELDFSTSGLENLQDIGEPSSVVPSMAIPIGVAAEPVDYPGNGLTIGMFLVAISCLFITMTIMIYAIANVPSSLTSSLSQYTVAFSGGMLVLAAILGGIGLMLGKTQQR